jgi:hypothetical protein
MLIVTGAEDCYLDILDVPRLICTYHANKFEHPQVVCAVIFCSQLSKDENVEEIALEPCYRLDH